MAAIDVTREFVDLDGEPIRQPATSMDEVGAVLTLKAVCCRVLMSGASERVNGDEKAKWYYLAMRIHREESPDLSAEEITLLNKRIGEMFQPLIVGQAREMLKV